MNDILFKNADSKVIATVKKLEEWVKDSIFEGKVYMVGGAVRDLILGQPVKDIDIVVELRNGGIMFANHIASKDKSWVIDKNPVIFETYGTAKVEIRNNEECKGIELECVQTRKEQYHRESRNPDTVFGTIEEDAKRRDLTINSMYYNISTGALMDYNGTGLYDLANQIIRTPTDPDITFSDDPLRILRVIRFSARYGWGIEKNTWFGMVKNAHRISIISQERITDEISKILCSKNPSMGVRKMLNCGILHRVMPSIYDTQYSYESRNPVVSTFDHTMKVLDAVEPYLEHRLSALFHDVGKLLTDTDRTVSPSQFSAEVAADDLKRMKYPTDVIKSVATAIRHHTWFSTYTDGFLPPDKKIRKLMNSCGIDLGATLDLMHANNVNVTFNKKKTQVLQVLRRIEELDELEDMNNIKLPVDGNELIKELGMKHGGPIIGTILNELKEDYFENPDITREECIKRAKEIVMSMAV
jgi:tRNA nucleotidyltransferase/poly(A) polymerase